MKKYLLTAIALLASATLVYAASWKTTDTEDSSVNGGEIVFVENEGGTDNNWMSLTTIKTWVLSALGAGSVAITDAGNYYTGTTVEAALQEAGADFADAINLTVDGTTITQSGTAPNITIGVPTGGIGATQIASTAVTAASYTYANFTVDADGRLTAASNGAAASTTAAGIVELAIDSEVNTGTATDRAVTPDSLSGSNLGTKEVCWMVKKSDTVTGAAADGIEAFVVPASMNGMNLVDVTCAVADLNSAASGATTVVLRRVRGATAVDMTSTGVTINYDEHTASDETVNTSNDDIATGDKIYVDVKAVTTANHKGLGCTAMFRLP